MRVNFVVEDFSVFKYIGCATAAKMIFRNLPVDGILPSWNSYRRDVDVAHFHTFGPLALLYRTYTKGVRLLTAHSTPHTNVGNIASSGLVNRLYPPIYRGFDHIITVSAPCDRDVRAMIPGVPTTMIPNGVDRAFFHRSDAKRKAFRAALGADEDEMVVLTVAQQTPRKGIYDFLDLAERLPDLIWVWVGGFPYGPLSQDYFRIRREKKRIHENVIFTGFIPDIMEAYSGADLFFMPSHAETFGLVILEALASGLPVLARGIPEFREIFGDTIAFFEGLDDAQELVQSRDRWRLSGEKAREATTPYDIRLIAKRHAELYRKLSGP